MTFQIHVHSFPNHLHYRKEEETVQNGFVSNSHQYFPKCVGLAKYCSALLAKHGELSSELVDAEGSLPTVRLSQRIQKTGRYRDKAKAVWKSNHYKKVVFITVINITVSQTNFPQIQTYQ